MIVREKTLKRVIVVTTNKELQKPMDDEYMEKLNRKFEENIFTKNRNNEFHEGQIPLVKTLNVNGKQKKQLKFVLVVVLL